MRTAAFLVVLVAIAPLLAGCAGQAGTGPISTTATDKPSELMRIAGLVESDTLVPLGNATLSILESNQKVRTGDDGHFAFPPMPPRIYTVHATTLGYLSSDLVARPDTNPGALDFVLQASKPTKPHQDSLHFKGFFECGAEALIISGTCDYLIQSSGGPAVFQNQSTFKFPLQAGWNTTIIDVVFDPDAQMGLDGLRITVRGVGDVKELNTYQQYGRFFDKKPFTARLEPGKNYTDGEKPVTANITAFQIDAYPQSRGYHAACFPATPAHAGDCFNGIGAGHQIDFDIYVTIFYVEPAPADFTLRQDA